MKSSFLKKFAVYFLVVLVILLSFAGCGSNDNKIVSVKKYIDADTSKNIDSCIVIATEKYSLHWDNEKKCVILKDTVNNTNWSSIPYSYYLEKDPYGIGMVRMHSPIYIEYIMENNLRTAYAQVGALSDGDVVAEKVDNGVRVTYYFANEQISVPVEYLLCDNGLEVRLIVNEIRESNYQIYSVSVSPFMCGAKNNTDSYIFVPSGSGTLMYLDDTGRNTRTISEYVYGEDLATTQYEKITNKEKIKMPVFGVKSNNDALCAVITKGAECARIDAEVGNAEYGYSSVYATFLLRGTNTLVINDSQGTRKQIITNTQDIIDEDYFSVVYTPLEKSKANYVGMAEVYRNWLKEKYDTKNKNIDFSALHLEFLGGALVEKNFLGIAYDSLFVATDFSNVQKITNDIISRTGVKPTIQLTGYGQSGIDIGEIAGGMKIDSKFGDFGKMQKYCKSGNINLYVDFDLINFSKNGSSLNKLFDSAVTSNGAMAKQYCFSKESYNRNGKTYNIVERNKISEVVAKLNKYINKNEIKGVSLSSIGTLSYSNYPDSKGYNKYGFSDIVNQTLNSISKEEVSVITSGANDYAAVLSDKVVGAPTKSSSFDGYDEDIPFYEIVFRDLVNVAISSVNLAIEPDNQFLKAMETGTSLSFSLCNKWDKELSDSDSSIFQFGLYENWNEKIFEMTDKIEEWYGNVKNAPITEHKRISKEVYYTEFSNGANIYTNYSNKDISIGDISIKANDYIYTLGGE